MGVGAGRRLGFKPGFCSSILHTHGVQGGRLHGGAAGCKPVRESVVGSTPAPPNDLGCSCWAVKQQRRAWMAQPTSRVTQRLGVTQVAAVVGLTSCLPGKRSVAPAPARLVGTVASLLITSSVGSLLLGCTRREHTVASGRSIV